MLVNKAADDSSHVKFESAYFKFWSLLLFNKHSTNNFAS